MTFSAEGDAGVIRTAETHSPIRSRMRCLSRRFDTAAGTGQAPYPLAVSPAPCRSVTSEYGGSLRRLTGYFYPVYLLHEPASQLVVILHCRGILSAEIRQFMRMALTSFLLMPSRFCLAHETIS